MMISQYPIQTENDIENLILFSEKYPWKPRWSKEMMLKFMGPLVSSSSQIFDLRLEGKTVVAAVLIDRVSNPGNLANLEILGLHSEPDPSTLIDHLLTRAKAQIPSSKAGLQIGFDKSQSIQWVDLLIQKHDLQIYCQTFHMRNSDISLHAVEEILFRVAEPKDDLNLYQTLKESFSENRDISIPNFKEWQLGRSQNVRQRTWLAEENEKIIGFLTLFFDLRIEFAEIQTIGVLPKNRGQGIGRSLIQNALHFLRKLDLSSCELTVAVENLRALRLYKNLGFHEIDHYLIYRSSVGHPSTSTGINRL